MRRKVINILLTAVNRVIPYERKHKLLDLSDNGPNMSNKTAPVSLCFNLINHLSYCIYDARGDYKDYTEFFLTFYRLSLQSLEIKYYML